MAGRNRRVEEAGEGEGAAKTETTPVVYLPLKMRRGSVESRILVVKRSSARIAPLGIAAALRENAV